MRQIFGDPDELCATVEHAARAEVSEVEREAEERADEIRRRARDQAEAARRDLLEPARARAREMRRRQRAKASQEERQRYLRARQELLDEVWERAEARLRALTGDERAYAGAIERLAVASSRVLPPGAYTIAADEAGYRLLTRSRLKAIGAASSRGRDGALSFRRAAEPLDAWGGLVLTGDGGRRRLDATFPALLELAREELLERIARELMKP